MKQLCIRLEKLRQETLQSDVVCRVRVEKLKVDIDETLLGGAAASLLVRQRETCRMMRGWTHNVAVRVVILLFAFRHLAPLTVYLNDKHDKITRSLNLTMAKRGAATYNLG